MCQNAKAGLCFVALYVDDNHALGHPKAIFKLIQKLIDHGLTLNIKMT